MKLANKIIIIHYVNTKCHNCEFYNTVALVPVLLYLYNCMLINGHSCTYKIELHHHCHSNHTTVKHAECTGSCYGDRSLTELRIALLSAQAMLNVL